MLKKKLSAVLALLVSLMLVLQAGPIYSFAAEADEADAEAPAQTEAQKGTVDEEDVSFMIDENGNKTELTDEMREDIYAGDTDSEGLYSANTDAFFEHEDGEVTSADGEQAAPEDEDAVTADAAALAIPGGDSDLTADFDLPVKGSFGSTITWESSNADILSVDNETGRVTVKRPAFTGEPSVQITLTATVTKGAAISTKTLTAKVAALVPDSDQSIAQADVDMIDLPAVDADGNKFDASKVSTGFTMPVKGYYGSVITYTSEDPTYLSVDNETGVVTVKKPPFMGTGITEYILMVKAEYNGQSAEKTFDLSLIEEEPATDYEKALYDVNNANIGGIDPDTVRQSSFYLEDKGSFGTLTWETSDSSILSIKPGDYVSGTDGSGDDEGNEDNLPPENLGGFTATVTRPSNGFNAYVTLTVTSTVNGKTASRDILLTILANDALKAFPSAEGYGQYSVGGRGGQVYHVTNLNASGPGSLQYGVEEMTGARTIVFDVGGVIDLTNYGANLSLKGVKGANVTIAGQTAPYPGITLKGYGLDVSSTHDVIIRNIRIRIGDVQKDGLYNQTDPMSVGSTTNLIVDHCTYQWAIDMEFRVAGRNVTFQNMLMGKGLTINSTHEKGGHSYGGAVNEGSSRVSFIKTMLTDSTQRTPRLVDANWVDSYNVLLFDCGNGFDIYNYEGQNRNGKYNVHDNFARAGAVQSNNTPYRIGRGRAYSGGVIAYFKNNFTSNTQNGNGKSDAELTNVAAATIASNSVPEKGILYFGRDGGASKDADLSSMTFEEWDNDPRSYDNNNKSDTAATLTYMDYPLPAPRGEIIPVSGTGLDNTLVKYALNEEGLGKGMGCTQPARDLYDTMIMTEMKAGVNKNISMTKSQVSPFFNQLEARLTETKLDENGNSVTVPVDYTAHRAVEADETSASGFSYGEPHNYKVSRGWTMIQGAGPALKGSTDKSNRPINWDTHTDVNKETNPFATGVYENSYLTDFEIGDWWGEYCGAPGKVLEYSVYDPASGNIYKTTNPDTIDETKYEIKGVEPVYQEVKRTVADLIPAQWVYDRDARHADEEGYKPVAPFMLNYMLNKYPYLTSYNNYSEFQQAKASGNLKDFEFVQDYTVRQIPWDGMGDGIPNWYKEYRGWDTTEYLATKINPDTGYTYLEEYINFMADDEPAKIDMTPAVAENFKIIRGDSRRQDIAPDRLGYSSAELSWNTTYRATCVIEYGTEPGKYTKSQPLDYTNAPDGFHTYHSVTLEDLQPATTYYYRVTTTDEFGRVTVAESDGMQFTTIPKPEGSTTMPSEPQIATSGVVPYLNQVRINWSGNPTTDEGYEIYYDTVDHGQDYNAYAHKLTGLSMTANKQVITGLENNIKYYILVVATNGNGKTPSRVIETTPSGVLYDFNFPEMNEEERYDFLTKRFMYILGGQVSIQKDPDTGKYVLMMLDETNSHGVNTYLTLPVTQDDKMTYEVKLKVLYQKQTDALNGMIYTYGGGTPITKTGTDEHNTWQINFSKDPDVNADKDSTKTELWDSAFSLYMDPSSRPVNVTPLNVDLKDEEGNNVHFEGDRADGTIETPIFKFGTTEVGTYSIGRTGGPVPGDEDPETHAVPRAPKSYDETELTGADGKEYVLPAMKAGDAYTSELDPRYNSLISTNTDLSSYAYSTPLGDAMYVYPDHKVLHGLWYYEKGSAQYINIKVVVDALGNKVAVTVTDESGAVLTDYKLGEFSLNIDPPYNIGKIELKSRNDGYSWVNVERIKISTGDGSVAIDPAPVPDGSTRPSGGGGGGGGGGITTSPTATATPDPTATADPNATAAPAASAAPAKYTDLAGYEWAEESINALSAMGIVNGTGDGKFSPGQNVTRAEYTTMLMRAFGQDTTASATDFTDVAADQWYTVPVGKAVALGVVNGYDDGSFGVNDNITREDMMVMAYRTVTALGKTVPAKIPYAEFTDQASISDYAVEAVEKMYCAEIINGVGGGLLDPKGFAERAQSAKIIYGLINMEGSVNE